MTWIPDLSREAYIMGAPFVRAAGWLSHEHSYPTGPVPAEFVDRLKAVSRTGKAAEYAYEFGHFMGYHGCELCPPEAFDPDAPLRNAGVYNFCVPFAHLLFVCPELIAHYVRDHSYRPPDEFITAVLEMPLPEEPQRRARGGANTTEGEPASLEEQSRQWRRAMDAKEYDRLAATFRDRLATLDALDRAACPALSCNKTAKGQCAHCGRWTIGSAVGPPFRCCGELIEHLEIGTYEPPRPVRLSRRKSARGQCAHCGLWTYGFGAGPFRCCGELIVHVETGTLDAAPPVIVVVSGGPDPARRVGQLLAERNVWRFCDADDFQPPTIVAKMRRGAALTDADCAPWLTDLHALCVDSIAIGSSLVLACPSLQAASTRGLNDRVPDVPGVQVVSLGVSGDEVHPFVNGRQLDEAIVIDSVAEPESMVARIAEQLALRGFRATTRTAPAE